MWITGVVFLVALDVLLVYTAKNWLGHTDILIVFTFHVITGSFFPHVDRVPHWLTYSGLSLHIISLWIAFFPVPIGFVVATASSFCYIFSAAIALSIQRTEIRIAQKEYQFRTKIVPEHIVRHSVTSTLDLSDLFKPALKFCACLSSDWRNYQAITSKIPATQLTLSLNTYHQWCQNLAREFFPRGNYYTDWIADELFLVVYAESPNDEREIVNQVVRFGHELLKYRPEFTRIHGIPQAVDIGISAGSALVGVMGPDSHRKATALGEVPGIARRLQTLGKKLREQFGQKDRVIFSRDILMLLNHPFEITSYVVDPSNASGDLRDLEIYYITIDETPTQKDHISA
jgi:class 3 adenylate cyclase